MQPLLLKIVCGLIIAFVADPSSTTDNVVGKYVVVKTWNAKVTDNGKAVDTDVELGDVFYVSKADGDRLWIGQGWIHNDDVVPFDHSIDYFSAEIRRNPSAMNYHNRAIVHANLKQLDRAIQDQTIAIQLAPNAAGYSARAVMWEDNGDHRHAMADMDEAIRLEPNVASTYSNRSHIWRKIKDYDKALADINESIRLDPKHVAFYYSRGNIRLDQGKSEMAIRDFEKAITIAPRYPWPYDKLAWIWATSADESKRNGVKAVEFATKACELTSWRSSDLLDTLAAAYAERGDFPSAVKWQGEALKIKLAQWSNKTEKDQRARLELYKANRPYRQHVVEPSK